MTLATAVMVCLGVAFKVACTGAPYAADGRSASTYTARESRLGCYSDQQSLWVGREIYEHHFPYVDGGLAADGQLTGGAIEYPVLTGVAMYLTGLPASTDREYILVNGVVLGLVAVGIAVVLTWAAGRRAWWWALAPPLIWYSVTNWDLLAVACVVGAVGVRPDRRPGPRAAYVAAALLGVGGAFKFYPLMFLLPLMLLVAERGRRTVARVGLVGVGVFVGLNLPIALVAPQGWWAAFRFQWSRPITPSTQSLWSVVIGALPGPGPQTQAGVAVAATLATAVALTAVAVTGWVLRRRTGAYPWVEVSAAMLCAYLLLNKVDSPQYILWVIPFLVLVRVPAPVTIVYFASDAALWFGYWRSNWAQQTGRPDGVASIVYGAGLGVRALVLVLLTWLFLRAAARRSQAPAPTERVSRAAVRVSSSQSSAAVQNTTGAMPSQ